MEASAALSRVTSQRDAETRASTDALTGLPNRRYFDEFCGLLARRRRAGDAVGVLMIDVDRFKLLNDTYGHHNGDEVLRSIGAAVVGAVREDDVPARYGGEEFVVLLRNPSPEVALDVGERVRAAVGQMVSAGSAYRRSRCRSAWPWRGSPTSRSPKSSQRQIAPSTWPSARAATGSSPPDRYHRRVTDKSTHPADDRTHP